jgi:fatty acid desaturase
VAPLPQLRAPLAANATANLLRNLWAFSIIFCGHFPEGIHEFTAEEIEDESKGHWYFRQMLGSANITGRRLFHLLSGNLSHQIEHHLFPDVAQDLAPGAPRLIRLRAQPDSAAAASRSSVVSMPGRLCAARSFTPVAIWPSSFDTALRRSVHRSSTRHPSSVTSIR